MFWWDPREVARYAYQAKNPSPQANRKGTQHGANRLACIGLSTLTVVPQVRSGMPWLGIIGGYSERGRVSDFMFTWPIWRDPITLAAIRALVATLDAKSVKKGPARLENMGIVELRHTKKISVEKYARFRSAVAERVPLSKHGV